MAANPLTNMLPERLRSRTPPLSQYERRSRDAEPHTCPHCDRKFGLRSPRYRRPDERPVPWAKAVAGELLPAWTLYQIGATFAECPRCGKRWPLFAQDDIHNPASVSYGETRRTVEDAGEETRWVDNSRGRSELERTITFTYEWQQSVKLDIEKAIERGSEGGLKVPAIELSKTLEESLKTHYEAASSSTRIQTEQVTVTAERGTVTKIALKRRHEWQHGTMRAPDGRGGTLEVPYSVIVGATLDVSQEDVLVGGLPSANEAA
jgi:hypothetical protein